MCYMGTKAVNVRELRQNLSLYLRRVIGGETLRVLQRGRPVAILGPLPERASAFDRLVAEGRATPPALDLIGLGVPPRVRTRRSVSAALEELRDES